MNKSDRKSIYLMFRIIMDTLIAMYFKNVLGMDKARSTYIRHIPLIEDWVDGREVRNVTP